MGAGTAVSEMLNYLGLESNEKAVIFSVQEEETWQQVKSSSSKNYISMHPEGELPLPFRLAVSVEERRFSSC